MAKSSCFASVPTEPSPRFRVPFDPVLDLSMVRATYALRRALELAPRDFSTLISLQIAYDFRLMNEAALPVLDRMASLHSTNLLPGRRASQERSGPGRIPAKAGLTASNNLAKPERPGSDRDGPCLPPVAWKARPSCSSEPIRRKKPRGKSSTRWRACGSTLASRPAHESSGGKQRRFLSPVFKMRESARPTWSKATSTPPAAIISRRSNAKPDLFEAHYCLAVLEQEAGHAGPAYEQAGLALKAAQDDSSRSAARAIAAGVARFARGLNVEDVSAK